MGKVKQTTKTTSYKVRKSKVKHCPVCGFMKMLKEDADSKEEIELIQEYARKIGEM